MPTTFKVGVNRKSLCEPLAYENRLAPSTHSARLRSSLRTIRISCEILIVGLLAGLFAPAIGAAQSAEKEPGVPSLSEPERKGPQAPLLEGIVEKDKNASNEKAEDGQDSKSRENEDQQAREEARKLLRERVTVVGGVDQVFEVPGSAHYIDEDVLERFQYDDVQRILRQVPGINIQDEEGFGLRPNIGMRGTGVERSQKITVLEDGILIAPAPYAAPAAYYFPTIARMRGVEVRKGSSAIRQGPFTTGGALNLLSHEIPVSVFEGGLRLDAGSFGERRGHLDVGGAGDRFGWFVETIQLSNEGFKKLDNDGSTGFDIDDYLGKFRWNSRAGAAVYRSLEFKLGVTDQRSEETYLGLTLDDFAATPYRRYAGSAEDNLDAEHQSAAITYFQQLGSRADWTARVYRNDFYRNWHKLDAVNGVGIDEIMLNPTSHREEMSWIRGEVSSPADAFRLRNNRRDYVSEGVESIVALRTDGQRHHHAVELGLRVHRDSEDRFQEDDAWGMTTSGVLNLDSLGDPGSQSNRIQEAEATAVYLEDRWSFGAWTITPGLRLEDIRYSRSDYGRSDPGRLGTDLVVRKNSVRQWVPGLALAREFSPRWAAFTSVHRGFAPPGPGVTEDTRAEISWNYEVGTRYRGARTHGDVTAFFNDYKNLLGRDTLSGGGSGTGDLFNGGAVEIFGLEAGIGRTFQHGAFEFPVGANYTYTGSTFQNSFDTSFADWSPHVEIGDELPYAPQHQGFVEMGVRHGAWQAFVNMSVVSNMRTKSGSGPVPATEEIEGHRLWDLALGYNLTSTLRLKIDVRNISDEVYLAARRPAGLRPGLPRSIRFGMDFNF